MTLDSFINWLVSKKRESRRTASGNDGKHLDRFVGAGSYRLLNFHLSSLFKSLMITGSLLDFPDDASKQWFAYLRALCLTFSIVKRFLPHHRDCGYNIIIDFYWCAISFKKKNIEIRSNGIGDLFFVYIFAAWNNISTNQRFYISVERHIFLKNIVILLSLHDCVHVILLIFIRFLINSKPIFVPFY